MLSARTKRRARACLVVASASAVALSVTTGIGTAFFACGVEARLSAKGEECFVASDCVPGLVCVPQRSGARFCTDDLSQVTGTPREAAEDAAGGDGEADAQDDAPSVPEDSGGDDTGVGVPDTGVPDTGILDAAVDG